MTNTAAPGTTPSDHHGTPATLASRLWTATLLSGIATAALGVIVLAWPGKSLVVASALFAVYLLISGIVQVILAFSLHALAGGRFLLFISGAASLILAVFAFRHFDEGYPILLLSIWIGVGFVFRGVTTTATAVSDRGLPGRGWAIFYGVITAIAGFVVLAWPFDSIALLTLVVGIWLVIIGVSEIITAFVIRKDVNTLKDTAQAIGSSLQTGTR
ncbi:MAG: HdeD family acid-resistance protein [Mycobacterium sp.]|uniref:HdeD family acid-resistance protein n=1 Tax=Mycobacterium sp. TaxID=1785 RepID=UPI003F986D9B